MEDFLERMRPRFARLLRAFRIPREDAEDLLQQTLLCYVASASRVETPDAWVYMTLRHHCALYWRNRRRRQKNFGLYRSGQPSTEDFVDGSFATTDARLDVDVYLRLLPPSASNLLRLRFLEELSSKEIAAVTPYKVTSIRRLVSRALERLALLLGAEPAPEPEDG
jgi:RNA polymerase sigma factor (sigma-70 family)